MLQSLHMFNIAIIILGLAGVLLCLKIYRKKRSPKPLVCMLGADCNAVLKSDYSTFFGIGLEIYGLMYYSFITLSYLSNFFYPQIQLLNLPLILFGLSSFAFLLSVVLISIQAFIIRSWCSWCLVSALISTLIFVFSIFTIY